MTIDRGILHSNYTKILDVAGLVNLHNYIPCNRPANNLWFYEFWHLIITFRYKLYNCDRSNNVQAHVDTARNSESSNYHNLLYNIENVLHKIYV